MSSYVDFLPEFLRIGRDNFPLCGTILPQYEIQEKAVPRQNSLHISILYSDSDWSVICPS